MAPGGLGSHGAGGGGDEEEGAGGPVREGALQIQVSPDFNYEHSSAKSYQ